MTPEQLRNYIATSISGKREAPTMEPMTPYAVLICAGEAWQCCSPGTRESGLRVKDLKKLLEDCDDESFVLVEDINIGDFRHVEEVVYEEMEYDDGWE